jgi:hypothetical protein
MKFIVIGNPGSDAGYWVIDANGVHHVGGWATEKMVEFSAAAKILRDAVQIRTPGIAEAAVKSVVRFAEEQIKGNIKETGQGATVVLVA